MCFDSFIFAVFLYPFVFIYFSNLPLTILSIYLFPLFVTITPMPTFTVLSYTDEIAVRRRTSRKDYFLFFGIVSVGYHTTSAYFPRTTVSHTAFFVDFGFIFRSFADIPEEF